MFESPTLDSCKTRRDDDKGNIVDFRGEIKKTPSVFHKKKTLGFEYAKMPGYTRKS